MVCFSLVFLRINVRSVWDTQAPGLFGCLLVALSDLCGGVKLFVAQAVDIAGSVDASLRSGLDVPPHAAGCRWRPRLFFALMDLYAAHKDEKVLEKLKSRNITPFFIPPGLTSLVQVHDTHINKSFKNEMRRMRSSWREHNPGEQIKAK